MKVNVCTVVKEERRSDCRRKGLKQFRLRQLSNKKTDFAAAVLHRVWCTVPFEPDLCFRVSEMVLLLLSNKSFPLLFLSPSPFLLLFNFFCNSRSCRKEENITNFRRFSLLFREREARNNVTTRAPDGY